MSGPDIAAERLSDDVLDLHLPRSIRAAKRCGVERSEWLDGWFISWSPRNDNQNAEGVWSDWVALADAILAADKMAHERARAHQQQKVGTSTPAAMEGK